MSDLFAFDEQAANPVLDEARANSIDSFDSLDTPSFHGVGTGIGSGFMRGNARVSQFLGMAGAGLVQGLNADPDYMLATGKSPAPIPDEVADEYFRGLDEHVNDAVDYWTPTAQEVGKVGQILGGLAEIVGPLAAGGGNPTLLIGSQEIGRATDLARQGVDAETAIEAGLVSGAATAAGLKIPILGSTLTSRLATGAAGNTLFGLGARGAENVLLSERGHADKAPPILDMASVTTDVLTGLLFGGLHHTLAPRINPKLSPSEVDAVLAARNAKSFQTETAPGMPDGTASEVGHQSALQEALEQLSRSEPVDVSSAVATHEASFANTDHVAESAQLAHDVETGQSKDVPYEPDSVKSASGEETGAYSVQEGELTDEQLRAFQGLRSDVPADQNVGGPGARASGESGAQDAGGTGEPLTVYRGASQELVPEHFDLSSLGHATGHPSSGLGVFFSQSREEAARYGAVAEHLLDIRKPKIVKAEDLPGFDTLDEAHAYQRKLIDQGFDGMVIDASHLGGPVNYVAFKPEQVITKGMPKAVHEPPVSTLPLAEAMKAKPEQPSELPEVAALQQLANERPSLIVNHGFDEAGQHVKSMLADVADQIQAEHKQAVSDAQAYQVAVSCFLGHGA